VPGRSDGVGTPGLRPDAADRLPNDTRRTRSAHDRNLHGNAVVHSGCQERAGVRRAHGQGVCDCAHPGNHQHLREGSRSDCRALPESRSANDSVLQRPVVREEQADFGAARGDGIHARPAIPAWDAGVESAQPDRADRHARLRLHLQGRWDRRVRRRAHPGGIRRRHRAWRCQRAKGRGHRCERRWPATSRPVSAA